ncbi:transglycosylase domain-containing protein [Propionibacterium australiense]|uniref:Penicillin binding protein transpeptidase domain n=1 Tax=Propionibacterium australiense TaxID=119981 RepID=A0A383S5M8_9ACTN|nr:transglycosylase domain-containing protein [Propionibacterium australiense]RLP09802.1 penicillin-binding protein [Propionibacterium australiense]RLP10149.1 penicillin-binding protein [Propionibacterium australiense]SYZ33280.1 Penicillin binding protein transpeptidase domain [Propionibacterium australiense]
MSDRQSGARVNSMLTFLLVSVVCGVVVAGMWMPFAGVASAGTKTVAANLQNVPADLTVPQQAEGSKVLLADGSTLAEFYDQNREYVALDQISPMMQKAQLAVEDHRFYSHGAIDLQGVLRAFAGNVAGGDISGGGSTLSQQYIKQVRIQLAQEKNDAEAEAAAQEATLSRKILEMRYAVALEEQLTSQLGSLKAAKDQILERYLNISYYGDGAYGVQAAAQHYFGIDASELNLEQSAMLAGLVQSPSQTDPVNNTKAGIERRNVVLDQILRWDQEGVWFEGLDQLTQEQVDAAKATGFDPSRVVEDSSGCTAARYPFICQYVENVLLSDEMSELGATRDDRQRTLYRGGLTIQTVINPATQDAAQNAISNLVSPTDPAVSVAVMTDPKTGLIKAMAQSRPVMGDNAEAGETYYNYAVDESMGGADGYQAGSTFKAFVAAAAIDQGFIPDRTIYNAPATKNWAGTTFRGCNGDFSLVDSWQVSNSWKTGSMNLNTAMAYSVNNYFVALERDAGVCASVRMAEKVGMKLASNDGTTLEDYGDVASFTLGALNVTPLSMAEAYATFANRGVHCDPIILSSIKTENGTEVPVPSANCQQVIDENTADGVNSVLKSVLQSGGTGYSQRLSGDYDQAGKTGTAGSTATESAVWFNAYTPDLEGVAMISVDSGDDYWTGRSKTLTGLQLANGTYLSGNSTTESGGIWRSMMSAEIGTITNPSSFAGYTPKSSTQSELYTGR